MQTFKKFFEERYDTRHSHWRTHLTCLTDAFMAYVDEVVVPAAFTKGTERKYEPELRDTTYTLVVDPARLGTHPYKITIKPKGGYEYCWKLHYTNTGEFVDELTGMIDNRRAKGAICSALIVNGFGIGGGIIDHLRMKGYDPIEVNFAKRS